MQPSQGKTTPSVQVVFWSTHFATVPVLDACSQAVNVMSSAECTFSFRSQRDQHGRTRARFELLAVYDSLVNVGQLTPSNHEESSTRYL